IVARWAVGAAVPARTNGVSSPSLEQHVARRQLPWCFDRDPSAPIAHLTPASSAKRQQSNRQRNAEVCHGYIRLASRRRMDEELQLRIWLSVRFQRAADR